MALLLGQFRSPIIVLVLVAAALSWAIGGATDSLIIILIVLASELLGAWQEWIADDAVDRLIAVIRARAAGLRDGRLVEVPVEEIVQGDVAVLDASDLVPGDGRILEARNLFVNEAALTGEAPGARPAGGLGPQRRDLMGPGRGKA